MRPALRFLAPDRVLDHPAIMGSRLRPSIAGERTHHHGVEAR